jgi:hypothetical protein
MWFSEAIRCLGRLPGHGRIGHRYDAIDRTFPDPEDLTC